MEFGVEWECPVRVDRAVLPSVVSSLVQSGIKLFLHQRNQIPLPLEQLHQKRMEIQRQRQEEQQKDGLVDGHSKSQETEQPANDDLRERIQFMISQRKINQSNLRRQRMFEQMSKREELAVESIMKCLRMLDAQIQENFENVVATGLFFGSSLHTPKEIVLFDLSTILKELRGSSVSGGNENDQNSEQTEQLISNLTRSFYKGIIMTEEFCDITENNLPSTRTHICLLSNKEFPTKTTSIESSEDEPMVLLENVEIFTDHLTFERNSDNRNETTASKGFDSSVSSQAELSLNNSRVSNSSLTSENNEFDAKPSQFRNKKIKVLTIKIDMKTNEEQSVPARNIRDNECLFCYQIPLRLKGITSCKNTFM